MSKKKIGFLNFGHWTPSPQSQVRTASDALLQSIDLAVAAEELGVDGAYFRVQRDDGTLRWTHTQGFVRRDGTGRWSVCERDAASASWCSRPVQPCLRA